MAPKEKAKELVFKKFGCSKQYALIAIDEIIQETDTYYDTLIASERKLFLEEVKQEIEKL
jgi:hypothetical protein